jgi:hypothetical protein
VAAENSPGNAGFPVLSMNLEVQCPAPSLFETKARPSEKLSVASKRGAITKLPQVGIAGAAIPEQIFRVLSVEPA